MKRGKHVMPGLIDLASVRRITSDTVNPKGMK